MTTTPSLPWAMDTADVKNAGSHYRFEATSEELEKLRANLSLEALSRFSADVTVKPAGSGKFAVEGAYEATVTQQSVVSLAPVQSKVAESFKVEYWAPELLPHGEDGEEISPYAEVPESLSDGVIPLGMLLYELFALAIDPYPRNEGEEVEWAAPESDAMEGPFAALAKLKSDKP